MTAPARHAEIERTRWGAVVAVSIGIVLVALDMTVVAVTLPELGVAFDATAATTQWVVLAYMLPLVALSIPAGRWLDRAGPLPAFLLAVAGFGVTSVLIAAAVNLPMLLAGRVLQGVFGALISVVGMPIVGAAVRPEHRARAMSIVLTLIPLAGVVGPALGGVLAEAYGWRSIFLINVPIVLAAAFFGVRTIPRSTPSGSGLPRPGRRMLHEASLLGVAATAAFLAIDSITHIASRGVVIPAALATVAVVAVGAWTRMRESRAVVTLLTRRELALPMLALPMITAGVGGLNFLVPYLLATAAGASPQLIGLTLLALAAGMAALSPLAGVLADRVGNRPVALAGAVLVLAGTTSLLLIGGEPGPVDVAWRLAVVGIGNGLFAGPNAAAILAATPPEQTGTASGVSSLLRTLGFALGPALGALAWTTAGGGVNGFITGVAVLAAGTAVALLATVVRPALAQST
jgi:DHA2 family multidrug resistance protein-like MFS transporter